MRVIANINPKVVGFRHPRMPSPAAQRSIRRQYRHTTISFRMARPDLSPQSRWVLPQQHPPALEPLVPMILNNFLILFHVHLY